ncbi:hypothetical protein MKX03_005537, partial [Papaver bracteatum]
HHHDHDHTHDPGVTSVSIVCEGTLDLEKANMWLGTLLMEKSDDIYRMKGLLSVGGMDERFVFQGVHDIFQGSPDRLWGAEEQRINKIVFIGKNLDSQDLEKGSADKKRQPQEYKNARGEGCVFNVELIDQDGTQIQATMFSQAANKFYNKFELGKVYYISKGTLKVANKQFKTVQNDYEMTLNENYEVEESDLLLLYFPFCFDIPDVIGVLQSVSPTMSIIRKANNETIPKCDITIADDSNKNVVIYLWNDLAITMGQELLDVVDSNPIVAIKCLKVGDFQGLSLSSLKKSTMVVNPDVPEAENLKSWYASECKSTSMTSIGAGLTSTKSGEK